MVRLVFVNPDGTQVDVDARAGDSVMRAVRGAGVAGVPGECGGFMNCLTCHCYVAEKDIARIPPATPGESDMLDCLAERQDNSRLTCQIVVSDALEGAVFIVPSWQG